MQIFRSAMFSLVGWNIPDLVPAWDDLFLKLLIQNSFLRKLGGKKKIHFLPVFLKFLKVCVLTFRSEGKPLPGSSKGRFSSPEGGQDRNRGWWQGRGRAGQHQHSPTHHAGGEQAGSRHWAQVEPKVQIHSGEVGLEWPWLGNSHSSPENTKSFHIDHRAWVSCGRSRARKSDRRVFLKNFKTGDWPPQFYLSSQRGPAPPELDNLQKNLCKLHFSLCTVGRVPLVAPSLAPQQPEWEGDRTCAAAHSRDFPVHFWYNIPCWAPLRLKASKCHAQESWKSWLPCTTTQER